MASDSDEKKSSDSAESELTAARITIAGYREAVERLIESKFDWALTAAHLTRRRLDNEYVFRCEFLVRELRARLETFRRVEPEYFAEMRERLRDEFRRRDARNIQVASEMASDEE